MGLFTSFQLKSKDADTRRRAAASLGIRGKTAGIASLQPLLTDPEPAVRQAAIEALGRIGDAAAVPLIVDVVKQADDLRDETVAQALRAAAVEAFGRVGPAAVAALGGALRDRHARLRETAIAALGAIGGADAVALLVATLGDDRSSVRQGGVAALARAGGVAAVPALRGALEHKDPTTRRSAALALGTIADPAAVSALQPALADRERTVREAAADALAAIGSRDAAAALMTAMSVADRDAKAALAARLKTMTWVPASQAERAVHAALHGQFEAAAAEGAAAVDPLVAMLGDRDPANRRGAAAALGRVGDGRAAAALVAQFRDSDQAVREAAVDAVGALGLSAAPALLDALGDRAGTVRASVEAALGRLGGGRIAGDLLVRLSAGVAAEHAGEALRVVSTRAQLDAARDAADALRRLVDHAAQTLDAGALGRVAAAADVILIEPGEVPGQSERVDLGPVRDAAAAALGRRG